MASITIRQLDEATKKKLRLRAARNGRSMEDEVRTLLRTAGEETGRKILEDTLRTADMLPKETTGTVSQR